MESSFINKYDVIVLGGGPAGYRAALDLDKVGKTVLLIEEKNVGGTCLHRGCIPTKSLLNSVKNSNAAFNLPEIAHKKMKDINQLYRGLSFRIQHSGVTLLTGRGKIKNAVDICVTVGENEYYANNLIIATGSSSSKLEIEGLKEAFAAGKVVYSDEFLNFEDYPENIIVVGGGVIGIEFASYLSKLGKNVKILEYRDNILCDVLDDDVRDIFVNELKKRGISIETGIEIQEIDGSDIIYKKNAIYEECSAELIIFAVGRKPNTDDIGVEECGIDMWKDCIVVDEFCRTCQPNVYACGDVIGKSMLAHTAYREAEVAVSNICGIKAEMNYDAIPSAIYSDPEVAVVGMTENNCKQRNILYYVKKASMLYSSRYLIEHGDCPGICKLVFRKTGELIGAQMVGNGSSEIVFTLADMIFNKLTEKDIREKIYPHPSTIEIIKEVISGQ